MHCQPYLSSFVQSVVSDLVCIISQQLYLRAIANALICGFAAANQRDLMVCLICDMPCVNTGAWGLVHRAPFQQHAR